MSVRFLTSYVNSSIGKKQLLALTGIGLMGFLFMHLLGNVLIILSPEQFNLYAHRLTSNKPLLYTAEAGLLFMFMMHMGLAFRLTIENKLARPVRYHAFQRANSGGATLASRTMPITGLIILVFIVLHLFQFKWGNYYVTEIDGDRVRDLYKTVIEYFNNPIAVAWYVFAMAATAMHVTHGFQSAFQTLGFRHPKYTPIIDKAACGYSLFVGGGFALIAILCYLKGGIA